METLNSTESGGIFAGCLAPNIKKGMNRRKMYFIITVDTEGDNLWKIKQCSSGIANITNRNGQYIERFQRLCEKYNLIPTYFVNYEMTQPGGGWRGFYRIGKSGCA